MNLSAFFWRRGARLERCEGHTPINMLGTLKSVTTVMSSKTAAFSRV